MADGVFLSSLNYAHPRGLTPGVVVRDTGATSVAIDYPFLEWNVDIYRVVLPIAQWFYDFSGKTARLKDVFQYPIALLYISGVLYGGDWGLFIFSDFNAPNCCVWPSVSLFAPGTEHHTVLYPPAPEDYWQPLS